MPVLGVHSWRQADTAAMARHFAINNTPIWLPQIDWGGATDGLVEAEFPIYSYLLAKFYQYIGINEWIGRGLSAVFSSLTIALIIKICTKLLDEKSAWWGGLFFAICPIGVYYGRTVQAESLLLLLGALSIKSMMDWKSNKSFLRLIVSWVAYTLACLIKVLPLAWLGLPILIIFIGSGDYSRKLDLTHIIILIKGMLRKIGPWLYLLGSLLMVLFWYSYSYNLGKVNGLSFGFWGESSDRSSLKLLIDAGIWSNLILRVTLRNLSIFGLPLLIIGIIKSFKTEGGKILFSGLTGVFICTLFALRASATHEYYQLPLQLFFCPLMGKGFAEFLNLTQSSLKHWNLIIISLLITTSLIILSLDYWSLEQRQNRVWMPLAKEIRAKVPENNLIISVTGADPTLLNLARRQGWILSVKDVTKQYLQLLSEQGAKYIVGSLNWEETHIPLNEKKIKKDIEELLCINNGQANCIESNNLTYIFNLKEVLQ